MSVPQRVQVFGLGVPAKGTPTPDRRYRVKWRIEGRDRTRSLKTRAEAERFCRQLLDAVEASESFDSATGEPASWHEAALTWFAWSQEWLDLKWRQWAGTTRRTGVEAKNGTSETVSMSQLGRDRTLGVVFCPGKTSPVAWSDRIDHPVSGSAQAATIAG